jgi:aryl sulfotransferase
LASYVSDFVTGNMISASWGTWRENAAGWIYARGGTPEFLLLRYEDMIADTLNQTARLAKFLGAESNSAALERAIVQSDADRMRKLEQTQGSEWVSTKGKRTDIPFVRSASSGGWKSKLPENLVATIEAAWGSLMTTLGYELVTRPEPDTRDATARLGPSLPSVSSSRLAPERR